MKEKARNRETVGGEKEKRWSCRREERNTERARKAANKIKET
jgi:hypothetical protein